MSPEVKILGSVLATPTSVTGTKAETVEATEAVETAEAIGTVEVGEDGNESEVECPNLA